MKSREGNPLILEMRHLRLIRAVADHGGLTRAGASLHLSQSALSHQLRDMEEALGIRLFERVGRKMVLTYAGSRILDHSRRALEIVESAETESKQLASGKGAILRLTTQCYTCYNWLPRVLGPFRRRFPEVEVRIDASATDRPIEALLDGTIDLALVFATKSDARVRLTRLFEDENVVVMAPGHPLARNRIVEARDLAEVPLYLYAAPLEETILYRTILKPAGVRPRNVQHVQLTEAAVELVKAGLGVSVLPRWAVEPHLKSGELAGRRLTARGYRRSWSAASLRVARVPEHIAAFIRMVKEGPGVLERPRMKVLAGRG